MTDIKKMYVEDPVELECICCKEEVIDWEMDFDPDNPSFSSRCCGYYYEAYPIKYEVFANKDA